MYVNSFEISDLALCTFENVRKNRPWGGGGAGATSNCR
jgi:hypothetical protein